MGTDAITSTRSAILDSERKGASRARRRSACDVVFIETICTDRARVLHSNMLVRGSVL